LDHHTVAKDPTEQRQERFNNVNKKTNNKEQGTRNKEQGTRNSELNTKDKRPEATDQRPPFVTVIQSSTVALTKRQTLSLSKALLGSPYRREGSHGTKAGAIR
jgi:hypothetical protein